jgi:uncharacterized protein YjbI with pentapeptide repeats
MGFPHTSPVARTPDGTHGRIRSQWLFRGRVTHHGDLRGVNLRRADLRFADLRGANLSGADLRGARLTRAKLQFPPAPKPGVGRAAGPGQPPACPPECQGADLTSANLNGATLSYANLTGAAFNGAILLNTNLTGANLSKATGMNLAVWGNTTCPDGVVSASSPCSP